MFNQLRAWFLSTSSFDLVFSATLASTLAFALIYFSFALTSTLMTKLVLPRLGIGDVVDRRGLKVGQIRAEICNSLIAIGIFGLYGGLTAYLVRVGDLGVVLDSSIVSFIVDLVILFTWNEAHFYACHWVLHRKWLFARVHRVHHESVVPTPFSTYSFHWFESLLLGSVMVTIMPWRTFNLWALLALPLISLLGNSIGHSNYQLFPEAQRPEAYSASREHGLHHGQADGNFGFLLPFFDRWFHTKIAVEKHRRQK